MIQKLASRKPNFFRVFKDKQHGFPAHVALKNPFFVIGTGRNMIRRAFNEFPFFSHKISSTLYMARKYRFAWIFDDFFTRKKVTDTLLCGKLDSVSSPRKRGGRRFRRFVCENQPLPPPCLPFAPPAFSLLF